MHVAIQCMDWQTDRRKQIAKIAGCFPPIADAPKIFQGCPVPLETTCACNFCHAWLRFELKWQVLNLNTAIVWSGARLIGLSDHGFRILTVQHVTRLSPHS
jgi:hypothetical protein